MYSDKILKGCVVVLLDNCDKDDAWFCAPECEWIIEESELESILRREAGDNRSLEITGRR